MVLKPQYLGKLDYLYLLKGELHLNLTFTLANTLTNVMRHDFKGNIRKLYIF